ncbi:MAG: hypothetical protein AB7O97_12650 [Planctomycetota bacterium]
MTLRIAIACLGIGALAAQEPASAPHELAPLRRWPLPRALAAGEPSPRWLDDVVAVRRLFDAVPRRHLEAVGALPADLDLVAHAVLLVPAPALQAGRRLGWSGAARRDGAWQVQLRVEQPTDEGAAEGGALFLLPRVAGSVCVQIAGVDGAPGPVVPIAADLAPDPDGGELLRVLGVRERGLSDALAGPARCLRATTPNELRGLRADLGLVDDAVFAGRLDTHVFVAVRIPAGHLPRPRLSVATEEGVDVLTVTPALELAAADAAAVPARVLLLTLPRRSRQLTVVLRRPGPGGDTETVLATFAPPG